MAFYAKILRLLEKECCYLITGATANT